MNVPSRADTDVADDVDGDGIVELIQAGVVSGAAAHAWLFYGPFTAGDSLSASSPDESWTQSLASASTNAQIVGGADFDGDGLQDFATSLPVYSSGLSNRGATFVMLGSTSVLGGPLSAAVQLSGPAANDRHGSSLAVAGDLDGDGLDELIVGSSTAGSYAGKAWLYYGPITSGASPDATLTGSAALDYLGDRLAGGRDMDGDGVDDVLITAYGDDTYTGAIYLFTGTPLGTLVESDADVVIAGTDTYQRVGEASCLSDDIDGDGYDDLVVAVSGASTEGEIYRFSGPLSGLMDLTDADETRSGDATYDDYGHDVSCPGDVDGDGLAEVVVTNTSADFVEVLYGPWADDVTLQYWGPSETMQIQGFDADGDGDVGYAISRVLIDP